MKVARSLVLAASLPVMAALLAQSAQAQRSEVLMPGGVVPAGTLAPPTPEEVLATNLRVLAANPRDVGALTRAGQSALAVGDPNAALGFFARAEQLAPADGRVKAGLGAAMVMMERPADAMPLFQQAAGLGAPERDYVKERGLAHDLLGNYRAAQRDYVAALRYGPDAETTRRYALSLGIAGDRDQALRLLEPLLRQQDQGAWRARAFVLALNGDQRGAERIVQQVMPGGMGAQMTAFLRKLPSLNASQRSFAVNFGTMPGTGPSYTQSYSSAELSEPVRAIPGSMTDTLTREEVVKPSFVADEAPSRRKNERAKRRRPGRDDQERQAQIAAVVPSQPSVAARTAVASPAPATRQPVVGPGFTVLPTTELPPPYQKAPVPSRPAAAAPAPVQASVALPSIAAAEVRTPPVGPEPGPIFEISAAPAAPVIRPVIAAAPAARAPVAPPVITPPPPAAQTPRALEVGVTATPAAIPPVAGASARVAATLPPASPAPVAIPPAPSPARVAVTLPPAAPSLEPPAPAPVLIQPAMVPALAPASPAPVARPAIEAAAISSTPAPAGVAVPPQASAPLQTAVATVVPVDAPPSPILTQRPTSPSLIGPPAPEPVLSAASVASLPAMAPSAMPPEPVVVSAPAAATLSEPIQMASTADTSTPLEDPQADAGLSSLLDDLQPEEGAELGLPSGDDAFRRARLAAKRKAEADIKAKDVAEAKAKADAEAKALKAEEDAKRAEARKHPPRVWVQVATGSAKSGIGITVKRVREQAGDTLKGAGAASIPFKATNRILMGPYKSEAEARQVVNGLAKKGLQANIFTSDAGQQVSTLSGR